MPAVAAPRHGASPAWWLDTLWRACLAPLRASSPSSDSSGRCRAPPARGWNKLLLQQSPEDALPDLIARPALHGLPALQGGGRDQGHQANQAAQELGERQPYDRYPAPRVLTGASTGSTGWLTGASALCSKRAGQAERGEAPGAAAGRRLQCPAAQAVLSCSVCPAGVLGHRACIRGGQGHLGRPEGRRGVRRQRPRHRRPHLGGRQRALQPGPLAVL